MKKNLIIISALSLLCASVSCTKDSISEQPLAARQTVMNAGIEDAKVSLDGLDLNWEVGDKIVIRQNEGSYPTTSDYEVLTFTDNGVFEGTTGLVAGKKAWSYYHNGEYWNTNPTQFGKYKNVVPATQTGLKADIKKSIMMYAYIGSSYIKEVDENLVINATFKPFNAILKFSVDGSLDVRSITITGKDLAATQKLDRQNGETSDKFYIPENISNTITVSRGGDVISGDVYVVVAMSDYATGLAQETYYNNTEDITFEFTNSKGAVATVPYKLTKKMQQGVLKNVGDVTSLPFVSLAKLVIKENTESSCTNFVVTVSGAEDESFHYTMGDDATVEDPTEESASATVASGLIIAKDLLDKPNYVSKYIKVLTDGKILCGYVRFWGLNGKEGSIGNEPAVTKDTGAECNGLTAVWNDYNSGKTTPTWLVNGQVGGGTGRGYIRVKAVAFSFDTALQSTECYVRVASTAEQNANAGKYYMRGVDVATLANTRYEHVYSYENVASGTPIVAKCNGENWYPSSFSILEVVDSFPTL